MAIHKIDDIIIYTNSSIFDEINQGERIEKEIAEWIVDHYEYNIILDILNKNYEGFTEYDKSEIISKTLDLLSENRVSREGKIENCLKNYLKTENIINLHGFVRFRLKEYRNELENVVNDAIDKYIVEKEYFEFIDLLKEYIRYQPSLFPILNVFIDEHSVEYTDEDGTNIKNILEEMCYLEDDLTEDDKLLTILVNAAPEKITIYHYEGYENEDLKRTIQFIFGEKVLFLRKN